MLSCADEDSFTTSSSYRLSFSTDTLALDTIFSNVPSAHKAMWVYNRSGDGLRCTVRQEKGSSSGFRVNIDGLYLGANNNYETLQAVNNQTAVLMQQNYANQINAVQGFNNVSQQITNQTNQLSAQLSQLGFQMENCCCSIKTKMDQMQIDDLNRQLADAQNKANLAQQSQTILSNLGRFVAWAGSGAATSSAVNS